MKTQTAHPRTHITATEAAKRLGRSRRWLYRRIQANDLEAFKWSATSMTISVESIIAFENRSRISQLPTK